MKMQIRIGLGCLLCVVLALGEPGCAASAAGHAVVPVSTSHPAGIAVVGAVAAGVTAYGIWQWLRPLVPTVLHAAGYEAAVLGLKQLSPETGAIAAGIVVDATGDAIKYLDSGVLPTADIVSQAVSDIFGAVDPLILAELQKVAATLSQYVPSGSTYLTPEQIGYVKAFMQGLQDGAKAYISNPNVAVKEKYTLSKTQAKATKKMLARPELTGGRGWFQR